MSAKSTTSRRRRKSPVSKPAKPRPDFPLFPHDSGRWARKLKKWVTEKKTGKLVFKTTIAFFGRWASVKNGELVPVENVEASAVEALDEYNRQWPHLAKGETPPPAPSPDAVDESVPTLANVCNEFLRSKRDAMLTEELSPRTYRDYERTTDGLIEHFGKDRRIDSLRPADFRKLRLALADRLGTVARANEINRIRIVMKFAWDHRRQWGLQDPVDFGQEFKRVSAKLKRRERRKAGARMFEAHELRTILDALDGKPITVEGQDKPVVQDADPVLKAMVLLGLNCGFGNTDCATLPQSAVDLKAGWIEHPRPKTEIDRRIPLWPETVSALKAALDVRPGPAGQEYRPLCFLTRMGLPWVRIQQKSDDPDSFVPVDPLGQKFLKLLHRLNINGRRGIGFYTLRHVFETIGGESRDQVAVDAIMGHVDTSMGAQYRERVSDDRLQAVVNVVQVWLWPDRQ